MKTRIKSDQLHIRRIYPDSSSESSYPETSFTVLGNAAYKIYNTRLKKFQIIELEKNELLDVRVFYEDKNKKIWIGTKTFVLVELPDQLHIRRIYPDSSSESSYPETSFTVLRMSFSTYASSMKTRIKRYG